jgi:hypothetical protein
MIFQKVIIAELRRRRAYNGREPDSSFFMPDEVNMPAESYGWNFDETRDLLSAASGLAENNPFYWN